MDVDTEDTLELWGEHAVPGRHRLRDKRLNGYGGPRKREADARQPERYVCVCAQEPAR